jgi:hypothetical protein
MDGFRMKVPLTTLTIEQINELLTMVEHRITEIKKLVADNLSPTAAELLLNNIFTDVEYRIAVMTNDEETLATFED